MHPSNATTGGRDRLLPNNSSVFLSLTANNVIDFTQEHICRAACLSHVRLVSIYFSPFHARAVRPPLQLLPATLQSRRSD